MTAPATQLRQALARGTVVAPFVYDGLSALIAQQHGFSAVYMTGHGTAAQAGFPDVGLLTLTEMVRNLHVICRTVDVPVIADADTGYGNPLNVRRTVHEYERAGAAGLHIEDQTFPKKCGFFEGKQVIPAEEYISKLQAALDARLDDDFLVIARTDALAVSGWDEVEERAHRYREAGADMVFVDGIRTADDLGEYTRRVVKAGIPALYNGGIESTDAVAARGFALMIAGATHVIAAMAVRRAMAEALGRGGLVGSEARLDFGSVTGLLGLPAIYALEKKYLGASLPAGGPQWE